MYYCAHPHPLPKNLNFLNPPLRKFINPPPPRKFINFPPKNFSTPTRKFLNPPEKISTPKNMLTIKPPEPPPPTLNAPLMTNLFDP